MSRKYKTGQMYYFRFLDHVLKSSDLLTCEVCGRVVDQDETKLVISWWNIAGPTVETADNIELLTIIKSTIIYSKPIYINLN